MQKKNTVLLLITIIFLIVIIASVTYAYFVSTTGTLPTLYLNLNVKLGSGSSIYDSPFTLQAS